MSPPSISEDLQSRQHSHFDALTMSQFDSLRSDALTVSRIRRLLRPLEMKLNTLAKILNKHYAMPEAMGYRESGATYSKKHRLRGFVMASTRRGPRAWASLFDNHPLSSVYGFIEATVAVEDAFRHLALAVAPPVSNEPLLSLQAITSKMIGRHIAEETLGRYATSDGEKGEASSDSEADTLGDWYEEIPIHCRRWGDIEAIYVYIDLNLNSRDALVAHAVQLIIFKIPVFLLELWSSLLQICLTAGLQEEVWGQKGSQRASNAFAVINLSGTYCPVLFLTPQGLQWSDAVPN